MTAIPAEQTALADLDALPGITWRRGDRADVPAIARLYAEAEAHDRNPERMSASDIEEYWDSPRSVPDEDLILGHDSGGALVAVGWSGCNRSITQVRRVHLGGVVDPSRRGEGIGTALLRWELAHGVAWDRAGRREGHGPLEMRLSAPVHQTDLRDLAESAGLEAVRYFFGMGRRLDASVPVVPARGVRLLNWDPARSDEALAVLDEGFRDHWAYAGTTPDMWQEQLTSASFRPDWSVLAVDDATGAMVGLAMSAAYEQDWAAQGYTEGWTEQLTVLRSHRGRGVASALLQESMRRFAGSGMASAGLGVDAENPTGALRLYESLGYHRTDSLAVYRYPTDAADEGDADSTRPGAPRG